jgi:hypothetical protein
MRGYSNRKFLNPEGHPSTGSVVAYHGEAPWKKGKKRDILTILEISDCHNKIRLHRAEVDTLDEFIVKMEKLRDVIDDFVVHLRSA